MGWASIPFPERRIARLRLSSGRADRQKQIFRVGGYRFVDDHSLEEIFIRSKSTLDNLNAKLSLNWNSAHSTQLSYVFGNKHAENRDLFGGNGSNEARVKQGGHPKGILTLEHTWIPNNQV